ncbi:MAG: dockerin type I domain-containing protein [Pirellulaceae bacterium]
MNEIKHESGNPNMTDGRDLPWLQDVDSDQNDVSDVWYDLWQIEYRDVWILDAEGEHVATYNLTVHDLAEPDNYATMKQMLVDAASPSGGDRPWQNPTNAMDVNGDSFVSPIDALQVINFLNSQGAQELPATKDQAPFVDTSGDGFVSPIDALLVINFLDSQAKAEAEPDEPVAAVTATSADRASLADAVFSVRSDEFGDSQDSVRTKKATSAVSFEIELGFEH